MHDTKKPTIEPTNKVFFKTFVKPVENSKEYFMTLIILEALLALLILIGIVWWTMFSGRTKGEIRSVEQTDQTEKSNSE